MGKKDKDKDKIATENTLKILVYQHNQQNNFNNISQLKKFIKAELTELYFIDYDSFINKKLEYEYEVQRYGFSNKNIFSTSLSIIALMISFFSFIFSLFDGVKILISIISTIAIVGIFVMLKLASDIQTKENDKSEKIFFCQFNLDIMNEIEEEQERKHKVKVKRTIK